MHAWVVRGALHMASQSSQPASQIALVGGSSQRKNDCGAGIRPPFFPAWSFGVRYTPFWAVAASCSLWYV